MGDRLYSVVDIMHREGVKFARQMMAAGFAVGLALGLFAGWLFL